MYGNTILILPLGIAPFVAIIVWVVFFESSAGIRKKIAGRFRKGITEYPTEAFMFLAHSIDNSIEYMGEANILVLTLKGPSYSNVTTVADLKRCLKSYSDNDGVNLDWIDEYVLMFIHKDKEAGSIKVVLSIPTSIVRSEAYIEHEIRNVGKVFIEGGYKYSLRYIPTNHYTNSCERKDGRLLVHIDRRQEVDGFLDVKTVLMSESQITRNIENRLWNRVKVECIGLDDEMYHGVIVDV
ncbi:Putative uncharacterized protein [Halomonas sp. R57-5]|uniref:hypothetical protein n=1 Tax=Halomonas sp. R57-5 TaxID=1610576 RepID=UPI0005FCB0B2|nr:hypothetical protein [Halomonas sp. R57-5]CEP35454.1 Putative uncharacterized protein [Halomonas sp. R57-5]